MKPHATFLNSYCELRAVKAKSKAYRITRYAFLLIASAFVFLLVYPQVLFAHEVSYKNFTVYSRQPISQDVYALLDKVEVQLAASQINNTSVKPKIFLTNSQKIYSLLSLYIGGNSFGKGFRYCRPPTSLSMKQTSAAISSFAKRPQTISAV